MNREANQQRHVQLIEFLNKLPFYNGRLNVVGQERASNEFQFISINEINQAVRVLTDLLNLSGGSESDIDLYKLLQVYLKKIECREQINVILNRV